MKFFAGLNIGLIATAILSANPLPTPRVTEFLVYDTTTQTEVKKLIDGDVIYYEKRYNQSTTNRSIIAKVEGYTTSVHIRLDNITNEIIGRTFHDMSSPYTLCGDYPYENEQRFWIYGCKAFLTEGDVTVTAIPYDGNQQGTALSISFIVLPAPERPSFTKGKHRFGNRARVNRETEDGNCYFAGSGDKGNGLEQGLSFGEKIPCPSSNGHSGPSHIGYMPTDGRDGNLVKATFHITTVCGTSGCSTQWVAKIP